MEEFSAQAVTDEKWLSFVFEQILSNALKYTHEGGIRIYGLDENGEKTQAAASFVVFEDSGIGIRAEDLPRIFERGFTAGMTGNPRGSAFICAGRFWTGFLIPFG